ncbi:MAG: hypothetical protein VCE74_20110 [Alphaproteobacteria bacterium]
MIFELPVGKHDRKQLSLSPWIAGSSPAMTKGAYLRLKTAKYVIPGLDPGIQSHEANRFYFARQ